MPHRNKMMTYWSEHYETEFKEMPGRKKPKAVYHYIGDWYRFTAGEETLRHAKCAVAVLQVTVIALFVFAGTVNTYLNVLIQVIIPGLLSILPLIYEIMGTVQFCISHEYITERDFQDIRNELSVATLIHSILLFVTAAFCLVGCISLGFWSWLPVAYLLCGASSLIMRIIYRKLPYCMEENSVHRD